MLESLRDSFVSLDVMCLPLGILSGMGFIGAGELCAGDNLRPRRYYRGNVVVCHRCCD